MNECKPTYTPVETSFKLQETKSNEINKPIRELVGSLLYVAYGTRPDIMYTVKLFSRYQSTNLEVVWRGLKRLLRYLKGTVHYKHHYNITKNTVIPKGYVDADFASEPIDQKSISGYMFQ